MDSPLLDTAPVEIRLRAPPLERALAAIGFSPVLVIGDPTGAGIAAFQERVRSLYPQVDFETEDAIRLQIGADGSVMPPSLHKAPVWRFSDLQRQWRISLTPQSVSVETRHGYRNRNDFVDRLLFVLETMADTFKPAEITRVGFRYLNVFGPAKLAKITEYVRPEFLGFEELPYASGLKFSQSLAHFNVPEGELVVKHGILAPGMIHEFMLQPVTEKRWYLDLDAFKSLSLPYSSDAMADLSLNLTARICSMFRWAMTQKFMDDFRNG